MNIENLENSRICAEQLDKVTGGYNALSDVYYTVGFAKTPLGTFSAGSLKVKEGENVWVSGFNENNSGSVKFFNRDNDIYFTPIAGVYSSLAFTAYDADDNCIGTFTSNQSCIEVNCNVTIFLTALI